MPAYDQTAAGVQSYLAQVRDQTAAGVQSVIHQINDQTAAGVQSEVFKSELDLFTAGTLPQGAPTIGLWEGASFWSYQVSGSTYLVNCDGRMDVWFPSPITSGYSFLNVTVTQKHGAAGNLVLFGVSAAPGTYLANAVYASFSAPGTYTLSIPTGNFYVGIEPIQCGANFSRIWLSN